MVEGAFCRQRHHLLQLGEGRQDSRDHRKGGHSEAQEDDVGAPGLAGVGPKGPDGLKMGRLIYQNPTAMGMNLIALWLIRYSNLLEGLN